jgi:hypothetical protein
VILDITDMTHIDTAVAAMLVATTRALRLLGAHAVLTGLRPEFARLLVTEKIELGALETRGSCRKDRRSPLPPDEKALPRRIAK